MRARRNDLGINLVDETGCLWCRARGDLDNVGQATDPVAGVNAFWRIAGEEIAIEAEPRCTFEHRNANFLGGAGIDRRFVDDDIAGREDAPDDLARGDERA